MYKICTNKLSRFDNYILSRAAFQLKSADNEKNHPLPQGQEGDSMQPNQFSIRRAVIPSGSGAESTRQPTIPAGSPAYTAAAGTARW